MSPTAKIVELITAVPDLRLELLDARDGIVVENVIRYDAVDPAAS